MISVIILGKLVLFTYNFRKNSGTGSMFSNHLRTVLNFDVTGGTTPSKIPKVPPPHWKNIYKSYHENIMFFREKIINCFLKIIIIMIFFLPIFRLVKKS